MEKKERKFWEVKMYDGWVEYDGLPVLRKKMYRGNPAGDNLPIKPATQLVGGCIRAETWASLSL